MAGAPTITEIKALIVASTSANALVSVTVLDNTPAFVLGTSTLVGGTTKATVTSTFSENVSVGTIGDTMYDGDGPGGAGNSGAITAVATGNVVVSTHPLTGTDQLPQLNVAYVDLLVDAVSDIAGNGIAPVTRTF